MEVLTRTTTVGDDVTVKLFSLYGERWDNDLPRLREWHRNHSRGPKWAWGDQRSAARGNRRSARAHRKKLRKPRFSTHVSYEPTTEEF
jgi:hypothetical protein